MANKNCKKRKDALKKKNAEETFRFQTRWGVKKLFGDVPDLYHLCLETEMDYIIELGLHEELLSIKRMVDEIKTVLNAEPVAKVGDFSHSIVAASLGIAKIANIKEFGIPTAWHEMIEKKILSIYYPGDLRNKVVEYARELGYNTSTYLGQPIVKFNKLYIKIERRKV